jgi:RNA recognition motif-containing protein
MLKLALGYAIWSYLSYIHFFLVCLVSVEFKSVYVRNLPSDISASEIEEEFKNFGTIKPDGVFLRTRKDVMGVCYAFVEFEDMTSVENAIKASPIYLGGRQVYIEERRPNPAGVRGASKSSFETVLYDQQILYHKTS